MCNCGKKRVEFSQQSYSASAGVGVHQRLSMPVQTASYSAFEYTGKTALTLRGNVTGNQYRFNAPGNRQNIDHRDIAGLRSVSVLRRVG
jgi:hypothetical protein